MSYKNENDKTGRAAKRGREAEILFAKRFHAKFGIWPIKTDTYRDTFEHVDFDAAIKDEYDEVHTGSWDVKSLKPRSEKVGYVEKWVWVEFLTYGHLGWLFGKADWIAFLMPCGKFLCVNRKQLLDYCKATVNHLSFVTDKSKAPYNIYVRWHMKDGKWCQDLMTLIPTRKLFSLEHWKL